MPLFALPFVQRPGERFLRVPGGVGLENRVHFEFQRNIHVEQPNKQVCLADMYIILYTLMCRGQLGSNYAISEKGVQLSGLSLATAEFLGTGWR